MNSETGTGKHLIEVQALVKAYEVIPVLRKLDLGVARGEFVALLGPNGSGKSTLLRLLCGLSKPTAGVIRIGGWELPQEAHAVRAQIGLVSHKPLLYDNLSARENLTFFAQLYNLPPAKIGGRIDTLLADVGLAKRGGDLVRTFSRGMQQRLSIARALLHNPDILLLDEPYTGLDQDASFVLDKLLKDAREQGRTILMSTHDLTRAAGLASRVIILSRGIVGYDQPAPDVVTLAAVYSEVTNMATAR
jgi:heme exporter protein A